MKTKSQSPYCTCTSRDGGYTQETNPESPYVFEWVCGTCRKPTKGYAEKVINNDL